jgi:SRSO17 transposase
VQRRKVGEMAQEISKATETRLEAYFELIGDVLHDRRQRASFSAYALGILGDGERKSCEPIAARGTTEPSAARRAHERLLHFLARSTWDDEAVRLVAARHAIAAMETREPVTTWIIDDTGFPKQGNHSVGVQRQYSGTLGKIGNCQLGVSLSVATRNEQVPIDFSLYLPESWTDDAARRAEAHIPEEVHFATKVELAIDLVERAVAAGIPGKIVLADSFYGRSGLFREAVRAAGLDYGVATRCDTRAWLLDARGHRRGESARLDGLAAEAGLRAFRRVTWRNGTKRKLSSKFWMRRVKLEEDDGLVAAKREPIWLIVEWPDHETKPSKFLLTTLPRRMSKKQVVRILQERWRTEQAYAELKGELGLDHFEGRSFPGWHHHVSVVLCCYAFVVAERVRRFPPSNALIRTDAVHRAA